MLHNKIKEYRTKLPMNQEQFAIAVGTTCSTIGRIERGERNPSLAMAFRIVDVLHLKLEDVFYLDDEDLVFDKTDKHA